MAGEKILVVDDEPGIRELIQLFLEKKDYIVVSVDNGQEAIDIVQDNNIDLILLDIEMPGIIGFDVCKKIREFSNIPIVFVSSKRDLSDRIEGIQIGADDYIMKPFDFHELSARINAILRRNEWLHIDDQSTILKFNEMRINLDRYELKIRNKQIPLSNKEFQLLALMANEPNRIWPAEQLYDQIWGYHSDGSPDTVKVHISNLRRKVEENPSKPKYIQTARGFGYKFSL